MKFLIGVLFLIGSTNSLDLNDIKKMKTVTSTLSTTTTTPTTTTTKTTKTTTTPTTTTKTTKTTTTPTTTTTAPTTTTTTPTTTTVSTTTTAYTEFSIVDPGALLEDCPAGCPSGWQYYNSKCYQKFDSAVTYTQAMSACQSQGAELVVIDDFDENDALRKAFDTNALVNEGQETWIGLKSTSGSWIWADGSSASFSNWAPTQPTADGLCVQMLTDALINTTYQYQRGGWKTYDCSKTSASYICERPAS